MISAKWFRFLFILNFIGCFCLFFRLLSLGHIANKTTLTTNVVNNSKMAVAITFLFAMILKIRLFNICPIV